MSTTESRRGFSARCTSIVWFKVRGFNSDTKVRIVRETQTCFYYPDALVVCDPNPDADTFHDRPVLIVEVVPESTRRIHKGEKRQRYLSIDSLQTYVLLEQDRPAARVYQRNELGEFAEFIVDDPQSSIGINPLGVTLNFAAIYSS